MNFYVTLLFVYTLMFLYKLDYKLINKMERQELREKFRIDIRRKQITQRMQAMRSKIHTDSGVNYQLYLPII